MHEYRTQWYFLQVFIPNFVFIENDDLYTSTKYLNLSSFGCIICEG